MRAIASGGWRLSDEGLAARDRFVAGLARSRGLPLAGTLGGGYGHDLDAVAERHVRSILTLAAAYAADGTG